MLRSEPSIDDFNRIIDHPMSHAVLDLAIRSAVDFEAAGYVARLAEHAGFPVVPVRVLIEAIEAGGLRLDAFNAAPHEVSALDRPFLCYLRRGEAAAAPIDLVFVDAIGPRSATLSSGRFGRQSMPRKLFDARWSGIVLMVAQPSRRAGRSGTLEDYRRQVEVIPDMLGASDCASLVAYCEAACFTRSRVMQRGPGSGNVVQTRVRSSSSVVLFDRDHPLLARLYAWCAAREGVSTEDIEHIQCVRYKRGQKFRPHFDGGLKLPRLATYLLYLNEDFEGGETYFPRLDLTIAPRAGACLRFASCDAGGRILWPSQHGGLPVRGGVKYALNIWVRCRGTYADARKSVRSIDAGPGRQALA